MIIHSGTSSDYGHYFTFVKDENEGNWHVFNDTNVRQLKTSFNLDNLFGYNYFYKFILC